MRQQVHDQGESGEAEGELECEDRAAGSDGDQPASPGPGPPDVLEARPAPGGPLGHNVPPGTVRDGGAARSWRTPVSWLAAGTAGGPPPRPLSHWPAGAFQSRSWTMTPLGSVTWNARSPRAPRAAAW